MSYVLGRPEKRAAQFSSPPLPSNRDMPPSAGDAEYGKAEWSLQKIAMWSSVDLIASLGSELPVDVFTGTGKSKQQLPTPSYLLDPAGDGYGLEDWIDQFLRSELLRGNAIGTIAEFSTRGGSAYPTQIPLYHPDEAYGWRDTEGQKHWRVNGREVDPATIWHRRAYPCPGRLMGMSPVEYHAVTIGLGLKAERFGSQWFTDGAHPSALLTNEEIDMKESVARRAKDKFLAAVRGNREPVVFGKGWKYEQIQVNPNESQFLETNKYTEAQCARIYGPGVAEVLGYETGNSLTYATLEGRAQHLLVFAANKWLRRADRALTSMLPRGQYARLNRSALLQSTTLERFRVHEIALRNRIKVVNEVREDEDLPPVEWGNEPAAAGPAPAADPDDIAAKVKELM
ncbi:MAG TPA: phage portal protein [Actinophytocola sp.]|uniref:phage portal protein n=1 Tax=Actinophytocola sp. TaxID=1872138 RepID=UPI002DDD5DDB|nr:phage portal protein [Actinophytocola sp.]HEV2778480.1 phage portal protein [Actinophytocola sp.]